MGVSVRTSLPLQAPNHSSILEHSKDFKHPINFRNFTILSRANRNDLRLLESIFITKLKPKLNVGLPVDLAVL